MKIDRKTFLRGAGVAALTGMGMPALLAAAGEAPKWPKYDAARPEEFWRGVRRLYPLTDDPVYLNTGGLGPTSQPVLDVFFSTTRSLQKHSETGHELFEPAREAVARFIGAAADEVCFTRNATEANSIIAAGLALQAGDEVIVDSHAHPGGSFPWLNRAQQHGIVVRFFDPDSDSAEGNIARIRQLISPRTRVVQVSHITCTTGLVMPVEEIVAMTRERGIWSHIDGAQSVGNTPVNLHALGCDSYAFSGHKWLGAPHETGVMYLRRSQLEAVTLTGVGAYSAEVHQLPGELRYTPAASRHEYGTRNAAAVAGLAEAVRFQTALGQPVIAERGRTLAASLLDGLRGIKDVEILTPRDPALRASIVTIRHTRASAEKFFGYLWQEHRLRCRPVTEQGLNAVRISTHIFNSPAECTRVIRAVHAATNVL